MEGIRVCEIRTDHEKENGRPRCTETCRFWVRGRNEEEEREKYLKRVFAQIFENLSFFARYIFLTLRVEEKPNMPLPGRRMAGASNMGLEAGGGDWV